MLGIVLNFFRALHDVVDDKGMGAWEILSDINMALGICRDAATAYAHEVPHPRLIGDTPIVAKSNKPRAMYASSIDPALSTCVAEESVFESVVSRDEVHPMDVQWAVMTLLAINTEFRNEIAAQSPARAADLVRDMPSRYERYLTGSATVPAMTPHEAVCDFVCRVLIVYSGLAET